jgi:phospholipase C
MNQLFGDAERTVHTAPPDGTRAAMQGFLQDFNALWETWDELLQMTETYTSRELPILYALAKQYAVSDRWYSSIPTQTNPNRAFALCGTSLGRLVNSWDAVEQFHTRTIWNALGEKGVSMAIFYHDEWKDGKCYTHYTFPFIDKVNPMFRTIVQIDDGARGFWVRAQSGTLPAFSYIEPKWGYGVSYDTCIQGNDYHPPTNVTCGEKLLYDVYSALSANTEKWQRTLLIVTFDEHGGTYDHHGPVWGATNPGDPDSLKSHFNFHLFGVRVPTLLISPYVEPSTVFRSPTSTPYDHTSILATLLRWQGIDPTAAGLYNRVAAAPTFEGVLRPTIVNPGIALPTPGPCVFESEVARLLEGIPGAAKRYIATRAKSIDAMRRMVEDWRAYQAT